MTLPLLALAWLLGMATVAAWEAPGWMAAAWFALVAPLAFALGGRAAGLLTAGCALAALVAGLWFARWEGRDPPALIAFLGHEIVLEGVVSEEPRPGLTTARFRFEARALVEGETRHAVDGAVLLTLSQFAELRPGDRLRIEGELEAPPELDFDYRGYLLRQGIVGTMLFPEVTSLGRDHAFDFERWLTAVRLRLDAELARALHEPAGSLAAGILLGRDDALDPRVEEDFRRAGLAHVVAVSGANISLVCALVMLFVPKYAGRRVALVAAVLLAVFYVVLAGLSPAVVRAFVMAMVFAGGYFVGRPQAGIAGLGAAAILLTAWNPGTLLDVGFQLSLAATAGLIVLTPWLSWAMRAGLTRARLDAFVPRLIVQAAALTLSASLATLPVAWANFERVTLTGLVANLVIEPLFVLAFVGAGVTALAGLASDDLAWVVGLAAWYPLAAMTWLAAFAAGLPFASLETPAMSETTALFAAGAMVAVGAPLWRYLPPDVLSRRPPRAAHVVRPLLRGALAGMACVVVWFASVAPLGGPGELRLAMLNVGQGDALLLTTPRGETVLIDGGPSTLALVRELGRVLPHWQREVDHVVLTHADEDHVGGLARLGERYKLGTRLGNGRERTTRAATLFQAADTRRGARVLAAGDAFQVDGVRFEVLWPPRDYSAARPNEASLVLRVTFGEVRLLLTGDLQGEGLAALAAEADLATHILKVPHHGSRTTSREFLEAATAPVALISVGSGNRFGHPAPEVLSALGHAAVFRTDLHGRVTVRTDGRVVRIDRER